MTSSRALDDSLAARSPIARILLDAEDADFEFIIGIMRSPLGFSADQVMDRALARYQRDRSRDAKQELVRVVEREILYHASSDLAYLLRWAWSDDAGIGPDELVTDVARKLNVKIRSVGPFVAKLQRLVRAVVEKELLHLDPEEQRALVITQELGTSTTHELFKHIKQKGPVAGVPLLLTLAGSEAAEKIATALIVRMIAIFVGRHAAGQLIKSLALRFPWWAQWIGPAAWVVTGAWVAVDLQGPAFRKTVPLTLYLGLISLRESEHRSDFWADE